MPVIRDRGRSISALCRRTATPVAAIAKAAKTTATIPVVRAMLSRPGRESKVTDALRTIAALTQKIGIGT